MNGADPLARVVFGLLVTASFAAFVVTQRLKHTPTAVQGIKLSASFVAGARGADGVEEISFRTRKADRVNVAVIDSSGDTVRTIARERPTQSYRRVYFYWRGREASGRRAPTGAYRIRVILSQEHAEVFSPSSFELRAAPRGGSAR